MQYYERSLVFVGRVNVSPKTFGEAVLDTAEEVALRVKLRLE
jgi:hypothetical protein